MAFLLDSHKNNNNNNNDAIEINNLYIEIKIIFLEMFKTEYYLVFLYNKIRLNYFFKKSKNFLRML